MPDRDAQAFAGDPEAARLAREAAHDLGNVVVALRGFTTLLTRQVAGQPAAAELVGRMADCTDSLGETVAWLQAIARAGGAGPGGAGSGPGGSPSA